MSTRDVDMYTVGTNPSASLVHVTCAVPHCILKKNRARFSPEAVGHGQKPRWPRKQSGREEPPNPSYATSYAKKTPCFNTSLIKQPRFLLIGSSSSCFRVPLFFWDLELAGSAIGGDGASTNPTTSRGRSTYSTGS
jgi:hypothetical protein